MQGFSDTNEVNNRKVRGTYSGEEGSFPNFNSEKTYTSLADDAMSKIFRNPLILDVIFAKLDLPDLKTCRLVCHDWNDVGVNFLAKRAFLHANKLFPSKFDEVPPVSDKLMRHLLISDSFDQSIQSDEEKTEVITKAVTKVSESTREIRFVPAQKEFIPPFLERMRTLGSTRVQRIDILSAWERDTDDSIIPPETYQKLPPQVNLTSLGLRFLPSFLYPRTTSCDEFQPLVQIWLDAAPNLTTLAISASLYPNLEGCKSLKVLKLECMAHFVHYPGNLNLTKLTDMLEQVKDSLIELDLHISSSTEEMEPVTGGPIMSKLTTLSIHATDGNEILDFFDEDHFPQLKTLHVQDIHEDSSISSFLDLWRRHRGVQSLTLTMNLFEDFEDEEFEEEIVDLFPAVKEFNLVLTDIDFDGIPTLSEITEPFKTWDLERVSVHVDGVSKTSELMDVLKAMSGLKGAKSAQFWAVYIKEDQFSVHIQDLIMFSKGFKKVEIFGGVVPEIMERMRAVFEASGAPIDFTGGVANEFEDEERK
ncbi:uncharacterized protein LOC110855744 [Folsomia candida]|uniref:uncharacterized protein LOC110855744 n=1 Tax=Folsomia candida TaxID=158441 RepID=UPI001605048C|nr:uncharacterized protein LOC110855744 [Folsomia candida]